MKEKTKSTVDKYNDIIKKCRDIYKEKNEEYGESWSIIELSTIVDQIMIKAKRIKNIQETKKQLIKDSIEIELIGIINYTVIALMKIEKMLLRYERTKNKNIDSWLTNYNRCIEEVERLLRKKNNDYNEAWKDMEVSSILDIIMMKLLRIRHIEKSKNSETSYKKIESNYQDIINYAVFYLIRVNEEK